MSAFDKGLATIQAEYEAVLRENKMLKKKLAEAEEIIAIIKKTPKFYTVAKVAEILECSKTTIYRAIDNGIVRAGYLSGVESSRNSRKLIPESELPNLVKFKEA